MKWSVCLCWRVNLASELERLNCCQNSWYICLSLWNYTAKAQAQDLHFQHVHSQQTRGWGGREAVLLGAESRGQTPGGSKFKKKKHIRVFSLLSRCGLTASISVSLIVFLQTWVGQCSWLRLRSQMCVYSFSHSTPQLLTHTHTQDLIWNTELKPLAVAYHELTSLPSRHQF